jgi:IclR family acetate operon transcriptional repressor
VSSTTGTPRTKSLGRAVRLLHAVADRPSGSSASELARASGLPRSTVTRTLRTLADEGLVEESPDGAGWILGHELVRLARAADPHRRLVDAARPALARLRDRTGESALLAVPHGRPGLEILLQLDPKRHIGVADWVGVDVPLHASSAGKLVLAELEPAELESWLERSPLAPFTDRTTTDVEALRAELARVRRQGWADLVDELEDGLTSISVRLLSPRGNLAAIVGVSGPTFRLPRARRRELLPEVEATAEEIERALAR